MIKQHVHQLNIHTINFFHEFVNRLQTLLRLLSFIFTETWFIIKVNIFEVFKYRQMPSCLEQSDQYPLNSLQNYKMIVNLLFILLTLLNILLTHLHFIITYAFLSLKLLLFIQFWIKKIMILLLLQNLIA